MIIVLLTHIEDWFLYFYGGNSGIFLCRITWRCLWISVCRSDSLCELLFVTIFKSYTTKLLTKRNDWNSIFAKKTFYSIELIVCTCEYLKWVLNFDENLWPRMACDKNILILLKSVKEIFIKFTVGAYKILVMESVNPGIRSPTVSVGNVSPTPSTIGRDPRVLSTDPRVLSTVPSTVPSRPLRVSSRPSAFTKSWRICGTPFGVSLPAGGVWPVAAPSPVPRRFLRVSSRPSALTKSCRICGTPFGVPLPTGGVPSPDPRRLLRVSWRPSVFTKSRRICGTPLPTVGVWTGDVPTWDGSTGGGAPTAGMPAGKAFPTATTMHKATAMTTNDCIFAIDFFCVSIAAWFALRILMLFQRILGIYIVENLLIQDDQSIAS